MRGAKCLLNWRTARPVLDETGRPYYTPFTQIHVQIEKWMIQRHDRSSRQSKQQNNNRNGEAHTNRQTWRPPVQRDDEQSCTNGGGNRCLRGADRMNVDAESAVTEEKLSTWNNGRKKTIFGIVYRNLGMVDKKTNGRGIQSKT
jgi:hypothetical protein